MDMHNGKIGIDLSRDVPTKTTATLNHFAFGHETISSQEAYYIAYWRQWWQIDSRRYSAPAPIDKGGVKGNQSDETR